MPLAICPIRAPLRVFIVPPRDPVRCGAYRISPYADAAALKSKADSIRYVSW